MILSDTLEQCLEAFMPLFRDVYNLQLSEDRLVGQERISRFAVGIKTVELPV